MTQEFLFKSQPFKYSAQSKIIATSIDEPFYAAKKELDWHTEKSPGLGFNQEIIKLLLKTHSTLVVYLGSADRSYFAKPDRVKQFMDNNRTTYKIRDTVLTVIPLELFTHKMEYTS